MVGDNGNQMLFLLSGIGMMGVAVVGVVFWRKRAKVAWMFFALGAGAWFVTVFLKGIGAILTLKALSDVLKGVLPEAVAEPAISLYIGILTGIFECGGIVLLFLLLKRFREVNPEESIGIGVGFGGVEALLVGLGSFALTALQIVASEQLPEALLPPPQLASPWVIPAPIIERISALFIHIFSVFLIAYAVKTGRFRWFWLSFLYKTLVDAIAGYIHIGIGMRNLTLAGLWQMEGVFFLLAVIGFFGIREIQKNWEYTNR